MRPSPSSPSPSVSTPSPFLCAFLLVKVEGAKGLEAGAHAFGAVFSNAIFMGFPIIEAFLGKEALFAAAVYNISFQLLAFSVGPVMLSRGGGKAVKLRPSSFITPAALAAIVGFLLFVAGLGLPTALLSALDLLGGTTTPLSMVLIGAIISRMRPASLIGNPRLFLTAAFRLLLFPAVVYAILYGLGLRGVYLGLPVIVAAMPVAANSAILAEAYGGDAETSASLVFLTTLLSLVTIPLLGLILG